MSELLFKRTCFNSRELKAEVVGVRVRFSGGVYGEHSVPATDSPESIRAHWEGYCQGSGLKAVPEVGEAVCFPSWSIPSGWRTGRVVSIGRSYVLVAYRYKHGGEAKPVKILPERLKFGSVRYPEALKAG